MPEKIRGLPTVVLVFFGKLAKFEDSSYLTGHLWCVQLQNSCYNLSLHCCNLLQLSFKLWLQGLKRLKTFATLTAVWADKGCAANLGSHLCFMFHGVLSARL